MRWRWSQTEAQGRRLSAIQATWTPVLAPRRYCLELWLLSASSTITAVTTTTAIRRNRGGGAVRSRITLLNGTASIGALLDLRPSFQGRLRSIDNLYRGGSSQDTECSNGLLTLHKRRDQITQTDGLKIAAAGNAMKFCLKLASMTMREAQPLSFIVIR